MKSFVILVSFILAGNALAAAYQCEGKGKNKDIKISFSVTPKNLHLKPSATPDAASWLSRTEDAEGLAVYDDEQEYGDDSGIYGFYVRLAIPQEVAANKRVVTTPFKVAYRFASSNNKAIDTKLDCRTATVRKF